MASPILLISLTVILSISLPLSVQSTGSFSTRLTHRDSPTSPLYNPSLSYSDRLRTAARRSVARAAHFDKLANAVRAAAANGSSPVSEIIPDTESYEYLMTLNVGTPPFPVVAIADTGSDLIWTQCKPCVECYKQNYPIFDPANSTTYATVSCSSASCAELPLASCTNASFCQYEYDYGDGSSTVGVLSSETFTFESDGQRPVSVPKMLFGCSHETQGTFDPTDGGLVGLGGGPLSLVQQLGSSIDNKFSYCLVPFGQNSSSTLYFGEDAAVVGPNVVTTPMVPGIIETFYTLYLAGISVGDEKASTAGGQIIVDSGTTLTILDKSMADPLIARVLQVVPYPRVNSSELDTCFDVSGVPPEEVIKLPELTFEFGGGAAVKLPPMNAFLMLERGVVCLTIVSTGEVGGLRIFGNIAQQNYHVGFDLAAQRMSFAPADCAKL